METQSWDDRFQHFASEKSSWNRENILNVKYEGSSSCDDYSKQQDDKMVSIFLWRPDAEEYDLGEIDMDENQAMQVRIFR